jgi:hypothetical protein
LYKNFGAGARVAIALLFFCKYPKRNMKLQTKKTSSFLAFFKELNISKL